MNEDGLSSPPTVAEIAAALRADPVLVDPLFGNGRTAEVDAALTEVVDGLGFPAYVVLVPRPEGLSGSDPDGELATLLADRLGGDGLFVVHTDPAGFADAMLSAGDVPDHHVVYSAELELDPDRSSYDDLTAAGRIARDLELVAAGGRMTQEEYDAYASEAVWQDPAPWDLDYDPPGPGTYAALTTFAFVAVAGVVWLLLRNVARWRSTAPGARALERRRQGRPAHETEGPAQVRARAERELDALAQRFAAGPVVPGDRQVLLDGSYDTARAVLAHTGTDDRDLDDLAGALVLTRVVDRALRGRGKDSPPYRPCFFDPRHGEGVRRRTLPVGDTQLTVPACRRCGHTRGDALDPMSVPRGPLGRERPWYEHDTVWARTGYGAFVDDLWRHVTADLRERSR